MTRNRIEINPKNEETARALKAIEAISIRDKVSEAFIARKIDVLTATMTKLKHGFSGIQHEHLRRLEDIFNVNPEFLTGRSDKIFIDSTGKEPETIYCKQFCDLIEKFKDQLPPGRIMKFSLGGTGDSKIDTITLSFVEK